MPKMMVAAPRAGLDRGRASASCDSTLLWNVWLLGPCGCWDHVTVGSVWQLD